MLRWIHAFIQVCLFAYVWSACVCVMYVAADLWMPVCAVEACTACWYEYWLWTYLFINYCMLPLCRHWRMWEEGTQLQPTVWQCLWFLWVQVQGRLLLTLWWYNMCRYVCMTFCIVWTSPCVCVCLSACAGDVQCFLCACAWCVRFMCKHLHMHMCAQCVYAMKYIWWSSYVCLYSSEVQLLSCLVLYVILACWSVHTDLRDPENIKNLVS